MKVKKTMSLCTLEHYEIDIHMDSVKNIHVLKVRKSEFPNVYNIWICIVKTLTSG